MSSVASYDEIKSIVYGKLVDHTIDDDYEDLSERLFGDGNCFNSSEVRKRMYGMRVVIDAVENERIADVAPDVLSDIELEKIELAKQRQRFFDQRMAYKKLLRERSRQEELNDIMKSAITDGDLPSLSYIRNDTYTSGNDLLVSLNDMHYGACVDNYWAKYDTDVCARMLSGYLDRIIKIGEMHHSENCYVWCNGDCISGNIHYSIAVTNKENVIKQIIGVSELISLFIAELSKHFNKVIFVSVAGNHSRINPNKDQTVKGERLDDLIEWYLDARLNEFDNVVIGTSGKIDDTMYVIDIRGKNYVGVHGDYDGSASKVQALQTMVGRNVYAVLSGHLHHNKRDVVMGIKTVMAGSFLGMDDYCVEKRIYGKPEQMVCVCDNSGIICSYDIDL